jgi:hypothetical protein
VLLRVGCTRVVATLGCAPLLLDAYQVQIEQYILSEALFETLLVAAVGTVLWRSREGARQLSPSRAAAVAFLVGLSVLVRLDALGFVVPLIGWLLWARARQGTARSWRPLVAAVIALAIPISLLFGLRGAKGNGASINGSEPIWLYARVASFADCPHDGLPAKELALCPTQPAGHRPGPLYFQDSADAPDWRFLSTHPGDTAALEDFARRVIVHQPLDYLQAVVTDFAQQFRPTRAQIAGGPEVRSWEFRLTLTPVDPTKPVPQQMVDRYGKGLARINVGIARVLRGYQRYVFVPGPVMALLLLMGAFALTIRRRHPLAPALLFIVLSGIVSVLFATATVLFSWRYMLPTLLFYPPAGALAWTMLRASRPTLSVPDLGEAVPAVAASP